MDGDCSSCTANPCRRVSSKTGSPVLFVKSAMSTESFSPNANLLALVDQANNTNRQ